MAVVLKFPTPKVTGAVPRPQMWQCKCGSQWFSFTETGDIYCAGSCGHFICNIKVEKR